LPASLARDDSSYTQKWGNNRSVMPLEVLGHARATLTNSTSFKLKAASGVLNRSDIRNKGCESSYLANDSWKSRPISKLETIDSVIVSLQEKDPSLKRSL